MYSIAENEGFKQNILAVSGFHRSEQNSSGGFLTGRVNAAAGQRSVHDFEVSSSITLF